MLRTITGTYENGRIIWHETPPVKERTEVIVTFLESKEDKISSNKRKRRGGTMKGEVWISDDFNAPLDDLNDYM